MPKINGLIVGVISDTHGLLRPQVLQLFKGVDLILHAGDVGDIQVLEKLRLIAPVVAVRGNNDKGPWARKIREYETTDVGSIRIFMLHDRKTLEAKMIAKDSHVIVSGHSHRPCVESLDGILFVNPGSAGPRRFKLPVSIARLMIKGSSINAELIDIET